MSQFLTVRERGVGATPRGGSPEKVRPWHRDRLAVVYVRQSTAQQVLIHQESTRLVQRQLEVPTTTTSVAD